MKYRYAVTVEYAGTLDHDDPQPSTDELETEAVERWEHGLAPTETIVNVEVAPSDA